ncbi:hypothetical protein [Marinospirillum sp.]|uniref:hypothetical protein n=1 Tax=Marinospirillum sp. TaxID=2183934 RepID=UPI0028708986|nr:hypothetical protein [Marinospirillum sp.]MDR9466808.1 hypothetical protein [Marinospirillum sp.]
MLSRNLYSATLLCLGLFLNSTFALASSMTVIDESTEVDSVVNSIELPPPAEDTARQASPAGRNQAEQAREAGREMGRKQADTARQATQQFQERQQQQENSRETQSPPQTPRP